MAQKPIPKPKPKIWISGLGFFAWILDDFGLPLSLGNSRLDFRLRPVIEGAVLLSLSEGTSVEPRLEP